MNGGYGALANKYFSFFNADIAEAITCSGQLSIRWAEKGINDYLNKLFKTDVDRVIASDTDSVVGNSVIETSKGAMTISQLYDNVSGDLEVRGDDNYIKHLNSDLSSLSYSLNGGTEYKKIKYVMKHKVRKNMYRITVEGKSVELTEDHSIIVERYGVLKGVSVKELEPEDEIISLK